eukprot:gene5447-5503_t
MTSQLLAHGTVDTAFYGEGPALVLFHSLLADRSSFDLIVPELSRTHRVAVPALPGFGGSALVEGGLEAVADRMAEAIGEMGAPVVLLGNGYGGFVALLVAIRHPALVSRLVIADAGACFSEPGRAAFRGMAMGAAAKGLEGIADVAMRRLFAAEFAAGNPELVAARRAAFLGTDPEVVISACGALAELDLRGDVGGISVPVLVLCGSLDEATPLAMSEELAGLLPHAEFVVLEGLAHVPQLQDAGRFLGAVGLT